MVLGYVIDVPDIKRDMLERLQLPECAMYSNIYDFVGSPYFSAI